MELGMFKIEKNREEKTCREFHPYEQYKSLKQTVGKT